MVSCFGFYNGVDCKIFVNGVDVTDVENSSAGGNIQQINAAVVIGAEADDYSEIFDGKIDDVRIYNYALTAGQAKEVYNSGNVYFGE